jgi:hypothetical protein
MPLSSSSRQDSHLQDTPSSSRRDNDVLKQVIKKVRRQKAHILTFVNHDGAPHHNNYGEYIIKKGVVKRKMSGGSMSPDGVRAYACIQSVAMTCQLRNLSFHRFLKASLVNYIRTGKPMLLSDYEASMKSEVKAARRSSGIQRLSHPALEA